MVEKQLSAKNVREQVFLDNFPLTSFGMLLNISHQGGLLFAKTVQVFLVR